MRIEQLKVLERLLTRAANKMERTNDWANDCAFCGKKRPKNHSPDCMLKVEIQRMREWVGMLRRMIRNKNERMRLRRACCHD